MAIEGLNPYLTFNGTAGKAIALYEKALGAKVENLQRFGDVPGNKQPAETKDYVMHAVLRVGPGTIMISDTQPGDTVTGGNNNHVVLQWDDVASMTKAFDAVAAGGKVTMPLQDTFWGARFGMLVDPYGVAWMFNCNTKKG